MNSAAEVNVVIYIRYFYFKHSEISMTSAIVSVLSEGEGQVQVPECGGVGHLHPAGHAQWQGACARSVLQSQQVAQGRVC